MNALFFLKYFIKKLFNNITEFDLYKKTLILSKNKLECFNSIQTNLSDKEYIDLMWRVQTGKSFRFRHPKGFNEKIRWMQLNCNMDQYSEIVDKIKVRDFVTKKLSGGGYKNIIVPILGVYNSTSEINFDKLPNSFVIKCNHNSGQGTHVVLEKNLFDKSLLDVTENALHENYYCYWRERQYIKITPKVFIEPYIKNVTNYKVFCFNGIPRFLYVTGYNKKTNNVKDILYCTCMNLNWQKSLFKCKKDNEHPQLPDKPINLTSMINISKKLSEDFPFARIDFYEADSNLYFSEITFTPGSGFDFFEPKKYENIIGYYLKLKKCKIFKE